MPAEPLAERAAESADAVAPKSTVQTVERVGPYLFVVPPAEDPDDFLRAVVEYAQGTAESAGRELPPQAPCCSTASWEPRSALGTAKPATSLGSRADAPMSAPLGPAAALPSDPHRPVSEATAAASSGLPTAWVPSAAALATLAAVALALYRRLATRADAARHPHRAAILRLLAARPGLQRNEIAAALRIHPTTAAYHLRILEEMQCIRRDDARATPRYVLPGDPVPARGPSVPRGIAPSVVALARAQPGVPIRAVARTLGVSRQLAHHHAHRLAEAGYLRLERSAAGEVQLFPPTIPASA